MSAVIRKLKPYYESLIEPLVNYFGNSGIHPNFITLFGFLSVGIGSVFIYTQNYFLALLFLVIGALADSVDGSLARKTGRVSKFGAFLDSTVDRFSDALPFTAFGVYYASVKDEVGTLLAFLSLISSFGVSYTRARAESLGVYGLGGIFERTERWIVLILGILLGLVKFGLFVIFIGSSITIVQRVYETKKALEDEK